MGLTNKFGLSKPQSFPLVSDLQKISANEKNAPLALTPFLLSSKQLSHCSNVVGLAV